MNRAICCTIFFFTCHFFQECLSQTLPEGFTSELIFKGGGQDGVSVVFDPDGNIFVADKNGKILLYKDGAFTVLASLSVDNSSECGLLGIALDPEYQHNKFIYVYYTLAEVKHNRLSRFQYLNGHIHVDEEEVLLELDALAEPFHNGGSIVFGPDGKLYIATGDGVRRERAQSHSSLLGKILRLNPDGSIPTDNPFYFSNEGIYKSIYALGFRNPFTFSFSENGKLFVNDVGEGTWEEVNEVQAGGNYGWPLVEGKISPNPTVPPPDGYRDPIYAYSHAMGCAITGSVFSPSVNTTYPEAYRGKYFFGDFCNPSVKMLDPETLEVTTFLTHVQSIFLTVNAIGELYYLVFPGGGATELYKISYESDEAPRIIAQPESQIVSVGETAEFTCNASGQSPLSFQWFRNGIEISGATESHISLVGNSVDDDGDILTCTVTNIHGSVESNGAVLSVTNRVRPVLNLEILNNLTSYAAGDTIRIEGSAIDDVDGTLPAESLHWRVDFHHGFHFHPVISALTATDSIGFVVPRLGETSSDVWYRIHLSASNEIGLSQTAFVDIFPRKSTINLTASLEDPVPVFLDGIPYTTPHSFSVVSGMTRNIKPPNYHIQNDSLYAFDSWNNETRELSLTFNAFETDTTLTAHYRHVPWGEGQGLSAKYYNQSPAESFPDSERIDERVDFDWELNGLPDQITSNSFYATWQGFIRAPIGGAYNFHVMTDGAIKVYIADTIRLQVPDNDSLQEFSSSVYLEEGLHAITIEFYNQSNGKLELLWSCDNAFQKRPVSKESLYDFHHKPLLNFTNEVSDYFTLDEPIFASGEGTGADGNLLPEGNYTWSIYYGNTDATTRLATYHGTDSVRFDVPDTLLYNSGTFLLLELRVTDDNGFPGTISKKILPRLNIVQIEIAGHDVEFDLNGQSLSGSQEFELIKGFDFSLKVNDVVFIENQTIYAFQGPKGGKTKFKVSGDTAIVIHYLAIPLNDGSGLTGEYFSAVPELSDGSDSVRIDNILDLRLKNFAESLTVKWHGAIMPPVDDEYTIVLQTKDYAEMKLFGKLYSVNDGTITTLPRRLEKGRLYPIEITYQVGDDEGDIKLSWTSETLPKHIIPQYQLYPDFITATESFENCIKFEVYPNPVSDFINIESRENNQDIEVSVTNMQGRRLVKRKIPSTESKLTIDMRNFANGVYFLRTKSKDTVSVFKIIKK